MTKIMEGKVFLFLFGSWGWGKF